MHYPSQLPRRLNICEDINAEDSQSAILLSSVNIQAHHLFWECNLQLLTESLLGNHPSLQFHFMGDKAQKCIILLF
jgi:hypothetical protein